MADGSKMTMSWRRIRNPKTDSGWIDQHPRPVPSFNFKTQHPCAFAQEDVLSAKEPLVVSGNGSVNETNPGEATCSGPLS